MDKRNAAPWVAAPFDVVFDADLPCGAMKVYLALLSFRGGDGQCYPSVDALAERTKLSNRRVLSNIDILCAHGLVVRVRRGRGLSNSYILTCVPALRSEQPPQVASEQARAVLSEDPFAFMASSFPPSSRG